MEYHIEHEPISGRYRHFKGGDYEVVGLATHSETGEELVVYRACYGDEKLWVRPKAMFFEKVPHEDGEVARFERVE